MILTVFDETELRKVYQPSTWILAKDRYREYTEYINKTADRIQFNRYSGVPLK